MTSVKGLAGCCAKIAGLMVVLMVSLWWLAASPVSRWQGQFTHWNYAGHLLILLYPALLLVRTPEAWQTAGLGARNWGRGLLVGLFHSVFLALPVAMAVLLGWVYLQPPAARPAMPESLLFQLIFVGLAEEFLFRGYIQGSLNKVFGRPWRWGHVSFGLGLFAAGILFGFLHVFNAFNPFRGQYTLQWIGLITIGPGLFFGFLREQTGGIWAPAIMHASCLWFFYMKQDPNFMMWQGLGWFIVWFLFGLTVSRPFFCGSAVATESKCCSSLAHELEKR